MQRRKWLKGLVSVLQMHAVRRAVAASDWLTTTNMHAKPMPELCRGNAPASSLLLFVSCLARVVPPMVDSIDRPLTLAEAGELRRLHDLAYEGKA